MGFSPWKQRCLEAVAHKQLPVQPGDYLFFHVSGSRLLVTVAMPCRGYDNPSRGEPTMGQDLVGLMWTPTEGASLTNFWLDWTGYEEFWTIHRATV